MTRRMTNNKYNWHIIIKPMINCTIISKHFRTNKTDKKTTA